MGMGLQTVDDSIYNQPQPTLAAPPPAPVPQVDSIYRAAAPQAPMQASAVALQAATPAPAQSQKSFTQARTRNLPLLAILGRHL
mgnify:CR=1 FL=1|jgi:hypothetical protein